MSFLSLLESAASQVQGALACAVMGVDGISVETHTVDDAGLELNNSWIEFSGVLSQLKTACEGLKTGALTELTITTEKCLTLVRMVTSEYFLILALKPDGNYGKARYVLRILAPKVKAEL